MEQIKQTAMAYTARCPSPLGEILLASDGESLTGLWFAGQRHLPLQLGEGREGDLPLFASVRAWLGLYFAGERPEALLPLRPSGTPFQRAVWEALGTIPYGQTATYGQLAARLAREGKWVRPSPRAVGGAVARNPISILLPCHRVLGASGALTGYAGGLARKAFLLALERGEDPAAPLL